ncbi:MAG: hypothetical protein IPN91_07710 [Holophagaceae bacterium]|uniref:Uncharacterized protein n=1 Tax=Candidatus Geothrix odensensis TaxID=2954440 RepID=A0A936K7L4_9BACT|nr:hypothetical protein [Candidatus Geothrix odensensis]
MAKLVLKSLAEKYGGGVVEEPPVFLGGPPPQAPPPAVESTKPLEVEELSAGELLEEIDEIPVESGPPAHPHAPARDTCPTAAWWKSRWCSTAASSAATPGGDPAEALHQVGRETLRVFR